MDLDFLGLGNRSPEDLAVMLRTGALNEAIVSSLLRLMGDIWPEPAHATVHLESHQWAQLCDLVTLSVIIMSDEVTKP